MTKRHHPLSRAERLELKAKFETPKKVPRSIKGKIKDAIKDIETKEELHESLEQRNING